MFNSPCLIKALHNSEWVCGTVSNGTYYWSEQEILSPEVQENNSKSKDFATYEWAENFQYITLTPTQANLILEAINNNETQLELDLVVIPEMMFVTSYKNKIEITDNLVIIHQTSKINLDGSEFKHTTYKIPKTIFLESMEEIPKGFFSNFWSDKVVVFPNSNNNTI
jgi:hypothetical protein